ncbi:hypothetical protein EON63_05845 [archaeon]|nr:MAG: hypothetical protein EON63_05845 [archaeon]
MQKEMSLDNFTTAIAYEPKHDPIAAFRRRSASIQSNNTLDTAESDVDPEILLNDMEVSDSPNVALRKKIGT